MNTIRPSISKMSNDDETFVENILSIDFMDCFYNADTFRLLKLLDWRNEKRLLPKLQQYAQTRENVQVLKGRDLEGIGMKHYQFSEIARCVEQDLCVTQLRDGRVYRGVLDYGGPRTVAIKVWRFKGLPMRPHLRFYPARLYNDIYLLKKKLNFEKYLPKLIGYSIDRGFATVYDIPPEKCLYGALNDENFSLEDRMLASLGVARALQLFHDQNMRFGPLSSRIVILDKDMNVYLCDFGLCADVKDKINDDAVKDGLFDCTIWKFGPPELYTKEEWLMESDIYSFGVLLLEIISNVKPEPYTYNVLPAWAEEKIKAGDSLFHESFNDVDEATRYHITELLVNCTNDDMVKRPTIASVIGSLQRLNFFHDSSPLSKKPRLEQGSEFVI